MSRDNINVIDVEIPFSIIGAFAYERDGAAFRTDGGPTGKKSPNMRRRASTASTATTWGLGQLIGMGEWELLPVEVVG
jgi:hypothetical protein